MQKLPATYFGPAWWYKELLLRLNVPRVGGPDNVLRVGGCASYTIGSLLRELIDCEENFQKQTLRNRCIISTSQGEQKLTIPVAGTSSHHQKMCDTLISDHGNWRHQHWQALQTAYGNTPFFEYYQDYLRPFYIDEVVIADSLLPPTPPQCRLTHLLDFDLATTKVVLQMIGVSGHLDRPDKLDRLDKLDKLDKLGNLSILDLLFNKGPETINYL